ncbi:LytR/AlgR family response regulator transcription factor [Dyadobacter subterraneus]|uniref:Response regulator n=1 Tax=Dyadobacter subterraneus TaxID=2773304 RepID=A0ABR9W9I5_9BACT|nr:response regulator [Dyadobacter subterraneus]MBE9462131.1 response regulator [Dyadobacter subterraneus]
MKEDEIKPLQCLIIDDEPHAHSTLKFHMESVPWLGFAGSCLNGVEALEVLSHFTPDVIFLDVNMPYLTGLDLLEIIDKQNVLVVLTTAHVEYAVDGFDYDVADFLLKPVTSKKFVKTAHKLLNRFTQRKISGFQPEPPLPIVPADPVETVRADHQENKKQDPAALATDHVVFNEKTLWIKDHKKLIPILYKELVLIESKANYVHIYNRSRFYTTRLTMSSLSDGLPENFVLTHRSYIVNRDEISEIEGNELIMSNGNRAKITADARNEIFKRLM